MFLVSTYTSAKSWTSKPPLHSAVAADEWCQAKSSSTGKITDYICFFPTLSLRWKRLHLLYSMSIMLSVNVGPIHRRTSLHPRFYREDLIFFLLYTNIFLFPRLRPSGDHSTINLRTLSRSQNWQAVPWPDPSFRQARSFFQELLLKSHLLGAYHLGFD